MPDPVDAELPAVEQQPEPRGLDAHIEAAFAKHEVPEPAPDDDAAKPELTADAEGRLRGPDGKFASKNPAEPEPSTTVDPAQSEAIPAETVAAEPAQAQPIAPPERWSPEDKAKFSALPREAQEVVLERYKGMEADYTRKTQELSETRKSVEPLIGEVTRWSPYLQQLGVRPEQAFSQMLQTEYTLRTGTPESKQQALAYLAQQYGVPLPTQAVDASSGNPLPSDPSVLQLRQTVLGLQQRLDQQSRESQQREVAQAQAEFNALGQSKDQNGQLKFPHFERAKSAMIQLVSAGQAETWEQAYSKAVRLDDELYTQTLEAERKSVAAQEEQRRKEAVDKAKKAQPVKTSTGSPSGNANPKGLDAHISAAMERAGMN